RRLGVCWHTMSTQAVVPTQAPKPTKPRTARPGREPVTPSDTAAPAPAGGPRPDEPQAREFARKGDVVRPTVKAAGDLDARLRPEAIRRGMTLSAWIREAVEAHLPGGPQRPVRQLLALGAGRSTEENVSGRIDEILAAEWVPHR